MHNPSWFEILLLVAMMAASGYLFQLRLRPILDRIRKSKPDAGFSLHPVAGRIAEFVWDVMLQAKVIAHRPLPGLAHAFVFWGFCAFALVTTDHFLRGFGLQLVSPRSLFGQLYFGLAALFGAAVAASIVGLAIRRFLIRPRWLGSKVSLESGFIAFLIFTLMWTYLAEYLTHDTGAFGRTVWWLHTCALLVFLPLVPHTKHLHLVLSPAAVFLSRGGFSHIPALDGDEDFGLDTGKDVTQLAALQAYSCVECGRCTEHCPAYNTGKDLNPKEIILGLRQYLNEFGPGSEAPLLAKHISQEAAFQCTTCGACEFQCPVGVEHLPLIVGLRRGAVNTGKWEDDYGNKLFLNLERNGNPMGFASSERDKFIARQELPAFDGTQEYCLWLGCMGSYDPRGREIIGALVTVLRHLNVTFGVLRKERCTGDSARRLGNDLAFGELATANLEAMKTARVQKVLSICPHCVRTMTEDWKEHGIAPHIEHHSEFLARHRGKLTAAAGESIVFHDPCYLSRYRGITEEPRQVAALGGTLIEAGRSRERSFCCGAGGGLAFLGEEKGSRVSHERARELAATGAQVVGAACPFCNTMFRDALDKVTASPPRLLDIAEIAAASIPRNT
ncbi:MAG: (Fe-S)-binding protein [Acidobacteria bacterium]|nr:(Fe-S)-binding protein [Acidobacteriota bacterium]